MAAGEKVSRGHLGLLPPHTLLAPDIVEGRPSDQIKLPRLRANAPTMGGREKNLVQHAVDRGFGCGA